MFPRLRPAALAAAAALAVLAAGLPLAPALAAPSTLFFSEYVEGSSNNKALEIANPTPDRVDLSDGGWSVQYFFNGNTAPGLTVGLTGSVAPGDVFVLAQSSAADAVLAQADQTNGSGWFNGDDAVVLRRGDVVVDSLGQVGVDPGTQWGSALTSTADNTLRRRSGAGPDVTTTDAYDPAAEWEGFAVDTFDGLGTFAGAPVEGPATPALDCADGLVTPTGTAATSPVSASDADSGIAGLALTSELVAGIALQDSSAPTARGEAATAVLTVADTVPAGSYDVVIAATADDDPVQTAECSVQVMVSAPLEPTRVSSVQGSGAASPLVGEQVLVEAVVTSLITSRDALDGFFVQEQDADADSSPGTSEGVYVFCRAVCPTDLAAGDQVAVTGTVAEFHDSTQVDATDGSVEVRSTGRALPTAAVVTLPADGSTRDAATFESVEGMRTTVATTLVVSEYFNLARFGEVVLTAEQRPYQFTQLNEPDEAGYSAHLADLATRRIVLDDDSNDQNDATSGSVDEPYYYPTPGLSTGNRFRGGDTTTGLTGVFEYSFGAWKLRPVAGADYTFAPANPRPEQPDEVGGRLTVASFNVLNYFATIDSSSSNRTGPCSPSGIADCRGADSEAERVRQLDKIVAALSTIDADVVGLIEIQNDDGLATQQIVDALDAATAPGTYAFVDTGVIGTDAIKQAFLYKPATVRPVGDFALLTTAADERFLDQKNRPALVQTFEEVATGERVTVAVNHYKSKGSGCGSGDDSRADGSGNCDGTRTAAAQALADFLATDPTGSGDPDTLVIGDLNSYAKERPIAALEEAGFTNLLQQFEGPDSYGYVFDGQLGDLDHALANPALLDQVTGAGGWKINADELRLLDYNDTVQDAGEAAFERKSTALPLYAADPYRSSDHDPVVIGLDLEGPTAPAPCDGLEPTIVGTAGDDVLTGTNAPDVILGLGGDDVVSGGNGVDVICGGGGDDDVTGGNGADVLLGGFGADELDGGNGDDRLTGGPGQDVLHQGRG